MKPEDVYLDIDLDLDAPEIDILFGVVAYSLKYAFLVIRDHLGPALGLCISVAILNTSYPPACFLSVDGHARHTWVPILLIDSCRVAIPVIEGVIITHAVESLGDVIYLVQHQKALACARFSQNITVSVIPSHSDVQVVVYGFDAVLVRTCCVTK